MGCVQRPSIDFLVLCRNLTRPTILAGFIFIAEKGSQPPSLWKCGNSRCVRVSKHRGLRLGISDLVSQQIPGASFPQRSRRIRPFSPKAAVDHRP